MKNIEKEKITEEQINYLKHELAKKDIPEYMILILLESEIENISISAYNILLYLLKSNEI